MTNSKSIDTETYNQVMDSFKPGRKVKKSVPHRIEVNGEFITTISGKTVWRRIGDAKLALRYHIERVIGRGDVHTVDYVYDYLVDNNIVKFVSVSEDTSNRD